MDFESRISNHSLSPALIAIQAQLSTVLSICHDLAVNEKHGCLQLARQLCADIRRSIDVDSEHQLAAIGLDDVQAAYGPVVFDSHYHYLSNDYIPIGGFDVPLQFASEDSTFLGKSLESTSLNSLDFGRLQDSLSTSTNVASSSESETGFKDLLPLYEPLQTTEDSIGTTPNHAFCDKQCWDANLISDLPPVQLPPITFNSSINDQHPATRNDQVAPNGQVASSSGTSGRECGTGRPDFLSEISGLGDSLRPTHDLSDSHISYLIENAALDDSSSEPVQPALCENMTHQITISPIAIEDCSHAVAVTTAVTGGHVTTAENVHIDDLQMERCGGGGTVVNGAESDCGLQNPIDKSACFAESHTDTSNQIITGRSHGLINRTGSISDFNQLTSSNDALKSLAGSECGSISLVECPSSSSSSANNIRLPLLRCRWCIMTSSNSALIDCPSSSSANLSRLSSHSTGYFQSKAELERHIAMMHPDYLAKQCPHCDFTTKNRQNLWKHVNRKHRILNGINNCEGSAKNKNPIVIGSRNDLETFNVNNVSRIQLDFEPVNFFSKLDDQCDDNYASLTLNSFDDGIQGKNSQTGLEPELGNSHCANSNNTPIPVNLQKLECSNNGTFERSIKPVIVPNQTNNKEFKCEICEKLFNAERNLKRHFRLIHSKENPAFWCGCGKSFKMLWQLKRHASGGKKGCGKLNLPS